MAQGFLLDAATHLTLGVAGERDDVESLEDADGVLGTGQAIALLLPPPGGGLVGRFWGWLQHVLCPEQQFEALLGCVPV